MKMKRKRRRKRRMRTRRVKKRRRGRKRISLAQSLKPGDIDEPGSHNNLYRATLRALNGREHGGAFELKAGKGVQGLWLSL